MQTPPVCVAAAALSLVSLLQLCFLSLEEMAVMLMPTLGPSHRVDSEPVTSSCDTQLNLSVLPV